MGCRHFDRVGRVGSQTEGAVLGGLRYLHSELARKGFGSERAVTTKWDLEAKWGLGNGFGRTDSEGMSVSNTRVEYCDAYHRSELARKGFGSERGCDNDMGFGKKTGGLLDSHAAYLNYVILNTV